MEGQILVSALLNLSCEIGTSLLPWVCVLFIKRFFELPVADAKRAAAFLLLNSYYKMI